MVLVGLNRILAGSASHGVQELRTEQGVEIHAVSAGRRTPARSGPSSRIVTVPSGPGPGRGEYESPGGAALALNPHVNPNRNGWKSWTVTAIGKLLQSIR